MGTEKHSRVGCNGIMGFLQMPLVKFAGQRSLKDAPPRRMLGLWYEDSSVKGIRVYYDWG